MSVDIEELKKIIRQTVKEVVREEIIRLRTSLIPYLDDKEQIELEKKLNKKEKEHYEDWFEVDI